MSIQTQLDTDNLQVFQDCTYTTAKKKRPNQLGYLVGIWL